MTGAAIKALVARLGTEVEPTDDETLAAIGEAVDLLVGVVDAVGRLANAAEQLAKCVNVTGIVDHAKDASFATHNLSEISGRHY